MKAKVPCEKDCPRRSPTCHFKGNCKEYDEFVENRKKELEAEKAYNEPRCLYESFRMNCRDTAIRKKAQHKRVR